jgi:hypothetical protein
MPHILLLGVVEISFVVIFFLPRDCDNGMHV